MSIQPICAAVGFTARDYKTDKSDSSKKTKIARNTGFVAGLAASGLLMYSQIKSLKTIQGKKNLIAGFHERGKSLNDVMARTVSRDEAGKIIPLAKGAVTDRTKAIVRGFKSTLVLWGAGITAATTAVGSLIDANINAARAERNS